MSNKNKLPDMLTKEQIMKLFEINRYLSELKDEGKIELIGNRHISTGPKAVYWQIKKKGDF